MGWDGSLRFGKSRKARKSRKGFFDGSLRSKRKRGSKGFDGSIRPGKGEMAFRIKKIKGYGFDKIIKRALSHQSQIVYEDEQMLERQREIAGYRDAMIQDFNVDPVTADDMADEYFREHDREARVIEARENIRQLWGGSVRRFSSMVERFLDRIYRP